MRKPILALALCLTAGLAFGQMKTVNSAYNAARAVEPKLDEARTQIKGALENPESSGAAKTWFVAGFIENGIFEKERNKQYLNQQPDQNVMYSALLACYNYYLKAAELDQLPDEKGKIKPRYLKDIKKTLKETRDFFPYGGGYFYNEKDYGKAYEYFKVYLDIPKLPFMADQNIPIDTTYIQNEYNAALSAKLMGDSKKTIEHLQNLKGKDYNENEVYMFLIDEFEQAKDTAMIIATLKEGAEKFTKEPYYGAKLINLYITSKNLDEAINYINKGLETNPGNAEFWNLKGQLYEEQKKADLALECFQKAAEINPNMAEAFGNMGRIYYNQAVQMNEEISQIKDNKTYEAKKANELIPTYKKALPFFEKANQLNPEESMYKVALRSIYYNLGMGEQFNKIDAEMNK